MGLVEVAAFYDPEEAWCAKGFLAAQGIETFVQNEHHLTAVPWLRVALGGYRLLAMSEFRDDARQALAAVRAIGDDQRIEPTPAVVGTLQESESRGWGWWWLPIAFLFAVPFLPRHRPRAAPLHALGLISLYAMILVGGLAWIRS